MQIFYSYFRYTGWLVWALLVARCNIIRASCETKNQEGKIDLQKKLLRTICVRCITFMTARSPFYVIFCCFLRLLTPPSKVAYLLNSPYKDIVLLWVVFCVMILRVNGRNYKNLSQCNTCCLAFLRTRYYLDI